MTSVLISLGSNINPEQNLTEAVRLLADRCQLIADAKPEEGYHLGIVTQAEGPALNPPFLGMNGDAHRSVTQIGMRLEPGNIRRLRVSDEERKNKDRAD